MELWDLYDENFIITDKKHIRGQPLPKGYYHLVVDIWIINSSGQILLTKRHPDKPWPNKWECTGGSALAGENSLQAALREVKEEIGIVLDKNDGKNIHRIIRDDSMYDVWVFNIDVDLEETVLQEGEVIDIQKIDKNKLMEMFRKGEMVATLDYILTLLDKVDGI